MQNCIIRYISKLDIYWKKETPAGCEPTPTANESRALPIKPWSPINKLLFVLSFYVSLPLSSVLWCPFPFPHKTDVRIVFTSSCLEEGSCLIYVICVCLVRLYLQLFVGGLMSYLRYLCLFGSSLPPVVCRRAHVLFMLFVFVWFFFTSSCL